ncbi:glutathione S-transferase-like [Tenebrio molitor]|uniref:glutathione S-transferase-like n=1 Tax=Tenebrio molitor TaxID=7067 RepID=UPI0036249D46
MAPAYKLTYFDSRGLTEASRLLFKYGDIDFEDVRIKREEWPQLKETTPFGQLPVLEYKGRKVGQSIAIARYVGKLVKLAGNDDWENLEIDAVVDTFNDMRSKIMLFHYEQDEEKKKVLKETAINETIPSYMGRFDALVEKNKGHLALGRLTWADLYFTSFSPSLVSFTGEDAFAKYPNLQALIDKVNAIPAIKKWIAERPKTEF